MVGVTIWSKMATKRKEIKEKFFYYAPKNLKLETILPPQYQKYIEEAYYFISQIIKTRTCWQLNDNLYSQLRTRLLKRCMTNHYKGIIRSLEKLGIVEIEKNASGNEIYQEGKRAKGYKLAAKFMHGNEMREYTTYAIKKRIGAIRNGQVKNFTDVHTYLKEWLFKLDINFIAATKHAKQLDRFNKEIQNYDINEMAVRMLYDKQSDFTVCEYGRIHTVCTRLIKELRQYLKFNGEYLVNVDINNSQPLFLALSIRRFYSQLSTSSIFTTPSTSPPNMCTFTGMEEDVKKFIEICLNGTIYEELMKLMNGFGKKYTGTRKEMKKKLFKDVFYGKNQKDNKLKKIFLDNFPHVLEYIETTKNKNYKVLSHIMQREESKFMITNVCTRLMNEHPDIPIITIHDSIMTVPGAVETVKNVMTEEFIKLGVSKPAMTVEACLIPNLNQSRLGGKCSPPMGILALGLPLNMK